jgi:ERCC4-type nuclease
VDRVIFLDNRVGSKELAPLLTVPTELTRLEYGDASFVGRGADGPVHIGMERKTIMDLAKSLSTGRLSGHQLIGMLKLYDVVYLLVEGLWRVDPNSGLLMRVDGKGSWRYLKIGARRFMAREVFKYINTLQMKAGVIYRRTASIYETAEWLQSDYAWWQKSWEDHRSHLQWQRPVETPMLVKPGMVERVSSQVEGVGWDKARSLGKEFKSVRELLEASPKRLAKVKGIGKKLSEKIHKELNE